MQCLAERVSPATGYRHVGDLAWNWALAPEAQTRLWRHDGQIVAWAWLEPPDSAMLQIDPAFREIAEDVLDWIEASLGDEVRLELARSETELVAAAHRRGYRTLDGPFMLCLRRDLTDLPGIAIPPGYTLRAMRPEDATAWITAHASAFGRTSLTPRRYQEMMAVWPYRPEFAVLVEASDGAGAAYCQGWFDEVNGIGEFEPVGTAGRFRRLGLARAACLAVLHAFAAVGGVRAVVYSRGDDAYPVPRQVYGSLGFTEFTRTDWFHRKLSDGGDSLPRWPG
jgi:ribosomal protein S18 acetylase RimI-like enzyme